MTYRQQIGPDGRPTAYRDSETGHVVSPAEFEKLMLHSNALQPGIAPQGQLMSTAPMVHYPGQGTFYPTDGHGGGMQALQQPMYPQQMMQPGMMPQHGMMPQQGMMMPQMPAQGMGALSGGSGAPSGMAGIPAFGAGGATGGAAPSGSPLVQQGAIHLGGANAPAAMPGTMGPPTTGHAVQGKNLRMEGLTNSHPVQMGHPAAGGIPGGHRKSHGFMDATSVAILLPTLVLLALIIAAAHKKRLFPWQTIRTFNPPSGMMTPRDYEQSYLCPPNLRRHGRLGKRNPNATWSEQDGVVVPFGFLARTHLPVTIPMGRLPNKNMFLVAPSGSGKTTLMRAIIKSLLAKPCVIVALEAKANDPNLDEKREGFKYTVLPEAQHAGFQTLYFNPLDEASAHWNPLDLDATTFASSIVQDVNSLDAEEQHWAERDMGYIEGLAQLLKWGAVEVVGEDESGQASELQPLPCNPRGLMKLVNNRRNIVESLRQMKNNPEVNTIELTEMTQRLASIIRTDNDWDKNIQGVRGRLRMFKNRGILRVTEQSNIDMKQAMHTPTVLIFGAPASLGPDAESLAGCFVYQLQQALHTRYGTKSVLPLFAFFDEYQTLNIDLAGRLSAIVRGANGGLTVILQNISQIASGSGKAAEAELRTIFSNSAIRVCLHNADEETALFFSEEIGKHAIIVPGIADHYQATGFGIFPTSWNRIHSQQVVARVDSDTIKRMEKHHALVYLAPAGDPEFGESKPLMVDLRGIEEIARLHLLHNVNTRNMQGGDAPLPSGPARPGFAAVRSTADAINNAFGGEGGEQDQQGQQGQQYPNHAPQQKGVGQMAAAVGQAAQSVFGQILGKPREEQVSGGMSGPAAFAAVPTAAAAFANAGRAMTQSEGLAAQRTGQTAGGAPGQTPAFAGAGAVDPQDPFNNLQVASRMAAQTMEPVGAGLPAGVAPVAPGVGALTPASTVGADRVCPLCSKLAGKGKFCIECGQFIGAADQPASVPTAVAPSPAGVAPTALPQQQAVVGPMGNHRSVDGGVPQPRYGGLAVTARDNMPAKKPSLFESPAQIAEAAQQIRQVAPMTPEEQARLLAGTGGAANAGPLSARVAMQAAEAGAVQQPSDSPHHRAPLKSFHPDVSKFGFDQNAQKSSQPGVEF